MRPPPMFLQQIPLKSYLRPLWAQQFLRQDQSFPHVLSDAYIRSSNQSRKTRHMAVAVLLKIQEPFIVVAEKAHEQFLYNSSAS